MAENVGYLVTCPQRSGPQEFRMREHNGATNLSSGRSEETAAESQAVIAFDIPSEALGLRDQQHSNTSATSCSSRSTRFIVYRTASLFQDSNLSTDKFVGSMIISAQVGVSPVVNLSVPVVISFKILQGQTNQDGIGPAWETNMECVFWDYTISFGEGGWNGEGCELLNVSTSDRAVCQCKHLTSFAILVSRKALESHPGMDSDATLGISIVSYIGSALSMAGLLATVFIIASVRRLRSRGHQKLILGLSCTLLAVLVLFVAALAPAAHHRLLCQGVGLSLHVLLLMVFMWMSADATLLYTQLVTVIGGNTETLLRRLISAVFVLPIIIVVATASATGMTAYGSKHYCWISSDAAFYGAFITPMCLTLVYNISVLFLVVKSLKTRAGAVRTTRKKQTAPRKVNLLRISVSLSLLLGLTWVTGVLTALIDHISLQYIFAGLNTMQGVFIVVHTITSQDVRKEWSDHSSRRSRSARDTMSSSFRFSRISLRRLSSHGEDTLERPRSMYRRSTYRRDSLGEPDNYLSGTSKFRRASRESCVPAGLSNTLTSSAHGWPSSSTIPISDLTSTSHIRVNESFSLPNEDTTLPLFMPSSKPIQEEESYGASTEM
ncbi:adhesion G-protein coupled receptor G2-like [Sycon ciliatum]|uniref:adhesion G-protein coupled receptor G2-like n=1 Tax=Sycon ciliatum TaxID=27933 RepID=UPI0031F63AD8